MIENLPGYDVNYRPGQNPEVDKAISDLNQITMPYGGGIVCLDEQGNIVKEHTPNVGLQFLEGTPEDIIARAREAAKKISNIMGAKIPETIKRGLGVEKNRKIAEYLKTDNAVGLLKIILNESDKNLACEVIINSIHDLNNGDHGSLLKTALADTYAPALKALVLYSWKNNLHGGRFWKNPTKNETLFVDDDGELISFQGEIATFNEGQNQGMNYIERLGDYTVLTGPNKGKVFNGSEAQKPNYRPLKGPNF